MFSPRHTSAPQFPSNLRSKDKNSDPRLFPTFPLTPLLCSQFIQVNSGVPMFVGGEQAFPGDFFAPVGGGPSQHGGEGRLGAQRRLVVKLVAGNALDERFLLLRVRLRQIVAEGARRRELL